MEGLQDRLLDRIREEGVFVGRLESPDERLELLLLSEVPIQEAQLGVGDVKSPRGINGLHQGHMSAKQIASRPRRRTCLVESKLDTLNKMEGDGILQTTVTVSGQPIIGWLEALT